MGLFSKHKNPPPATPSQVRAPFAPPAVSSGAQGPAVVGSGLDFAHIRVPASGWCGINVVGESYYAQSFAAILGGRTGEHIVDAVMVREPENPYDKNAIRIDINRYPVGHIAKEECRNFHPLLAYAAAKGAVLVVTARLWASEGTDRFWSVQLDLNDPATAIPINDIPTGSVNRVWPAGRKSKLAIDPDSAAMVRGIAARAIYPGSCSAWIELRSPESGTKATAHFDGSLIGHLSPQASKNLATILTITPVDARIFARADVTGNSVATSISMHLTSPDELTEEEIAELRHGA